MSAGPPLTAAQLSQRGRLGAETSWARTTDRTARTTPGTDAFLARFDDAEDPEAARRAYMRALAYKSSRARAIRRARRAT